MHLLKWLSKGLFPGKGYAFVHVFAWVDEFLLGEGSWDLGSGLIIDVAPRADSLFTLAR